MVGTRPEAIKMAPVIVALKADPRLDVRVLATAQHREMLDQVLSLFAIEPDFDLDLMRHGQTLPELSARLLTSIDSVLTREQPAAVLAQGDTTTVLMTAIAAFYQRIPFGHVEAGLRTGQMETPFPEEMNRVLTSPLTRWHFAPTESARDNLSRMCIPSSRIHLTGNTVIDALLFTAAMEIPLDLGLDPRLKLVLVTTHRRENLGAPLTAVCRSIRTLVQRNKGIQVLYPVHPNPSVSAVVHRELGNHPRIILSEPLAYGPFIAAMKRAHMILTDSGGVQEEAPALAKPVLVLRQETERPEAVEAGVVKLVGAVPERILQESERLLRDQTAYADMAKGVSPYGDGAAAGRIARVVSHALAGEESAHFPALPSARPTLRRVRGGPSYRPQQPSRAANPQPR